MSGGGAGDWNLAVSELLLRHGANPFHSTYMFTGRDAYWWAEQHDLLGTQRIIRSYVQEQNIDDLLGRVALNQRFEAITWFRYVQGADLASIPLELQSYGAKREDIWYQLKSLGIWRKRLKKLRQEGLDNAVIAVELIDGLYAHWADVAQAFAAEGLTPEAIVELLLPIVDASVPPEEENREGVLNCRVAWTAAAAFYEEEGSLVPVREVLERFGFDPNGVIHAMPYSEERRQEIRQRMGLLAAGGGQS